MSDSTNTNAETPPQPTQPNGPVATGKAKWQAASTPVKAGIAGGAAVGGCFLLTLCCVLPFLALSWTIFGGGAGQKLVGKWEGRKTFIGDGRISAEFKSNGRFSAVDGLNDTWTGTWKVKLVEENDYHLNLVYDTEPDPIRGWTVKFKDNDTITIDGFMALTPTLKRQR